MQTLVCEQDIDLGAVRNAALRVAGRLADPAARVVLGAVAVAKHQHHGAAVLSAEERAELASMAAATWLSLEDFTAAAISRASQLLERPGVWRIILQVAGR